MLELEEKLQNVSIQKKQDFIIEDISMLIEAFQDTNINDDDDFEPENWLYFYRQKIGEKFNIKVQLTKISYYDPNETFLIIALSDCYGYKEQCYVSNESNFIKPLTQGYYELKNVYYEKTVYGFQLQLRQQSEIICIQKQQMPLNRLKLKSVRPIIKKEKELLLLIIKVYQLEEVKGERSKRIYNLRQLIAIDEQEKQYFIRYSYLKQPVTADIEAIKFCDKERSKQF